MLNPDPRTIAYSTMLVAIAMFGVMFVYWQWRRTYAGFGLWVVATGVFAVGFLLVTLRGIWEPPLLGAATVQLLSIIWMALIVLGMRNFFGRDARDAWLWSIASGGTTAVLAGSVVLIPYDTSAALGSAAVGMLAWRAAWILQDEAPAQVRATARAAALVLVLWGMARLWRSAYLALLAAEDYDVISQQPASILNYSINLMLGVLLICVLIALNSSRLEAELLGFKHEASRAADTDALTGTSNRLGWFESGKRWFGRLRQDLPPISIIVIAIDHLRQINTDHGHEIGDRVLADVAHQIMKQCTANDIVARVSGEEFAVLLPESSAEHVQGVAERLCVQIASRAVSPKLIPVTVSLGIATSTAADKEFDQMFRRAEHGLALAKAAGRNRVGRA